MSFNVSFGNLSFNGRKGRKLLCAISINVSYNGPPPTPVGSCAVRVSVLGAGGGPFSIEAVPTLWNLVAAGTVQSATSFPASIPQTFTAYASFFFANTLGPPAQQFGNDYKLEVIDSLGTVVFNSTFTVSVLAQPALNKSVVFVLDRTATMQLPSGSSTRFQRLKDAVTRGLGLFTAADTVGVVSLDHKNDANPAGATLQMGLTLGGVGNAAIVCRDLAADQSLPPKRVYQLALDLARNQSPTATVLLVTDGVGSKLTTTFPTSPQPSPASVLFIGTDSTITDPARNNLRSTDGSYAIAAVDTGEFAVEKLLSQILIDLGGSGIVSDPDGSLGPGDSLSFPLSINETDHELELIVFSDHAELLELELVAPGHDRDPHDHDSKHNPRPHDCHDDQPPQLKGVKVKRIRLAGLRPDIPDIGPGYSVKVSRPKDRKLDAGPRANFTFLAAVQSDLVLDAYASASGPEVGAELLFSAHLTEYGLPIRERKGVVVHVELRHPDGGLEELPLHERSPGRFEGSRRAFRAGAYTAHFIATGRTLLHHRRFRREVLRCVVLLEPGTAGACCHARETTELPKLG